jgi:hypothetical protein
MTIRRAALYTGGGTLLVAWFSSAASMSLQWNPRPARTAKIDTVSPADDLAADMQAQTRRLRQRLASAPVPQPPLRNPFTFETVAPRPRAETVRRVEMPPSVAIPAEPVLAMIGMAEDRRPQGVVRTAMIVTEGQDLIVAAVGDTLLQRYKVTAIGPDAVELADAVTGLVRRLALQYQ